MNQHQWKSQKNIVLLMKYFPLSSQLFYTVSLSTDFVFWQYLSWGQLAQLHPYHWWSDLTLRKQALPSNGLQHQDRCCLFTCMPKQPPFCLSFIHNIGMPKFGLQNSCKTCMLAKFCSVHLMLPKWYTESEILNVELSFFKVIFESLLINLQNNLGRMYSNTALIFRRNG